MEDDDAVTVGVWRWRGKPPSFQSGVIARGDLHVCSTSWLGTCAALDVESESAKRSSNAEEAEWSGEECGNQ
jgi:hypothetical protein